MTNIQRDGDGWYIYTDGATRTHMPPEVVTIEQANVYARTGLVLAQSAAIQAERMFTMSAMKQWLDGGDSMRSEVGQLLGRFTSVIKIWGSSKLQEVLDATAPGAIVADTGLTKEQIQEMQELWSSMVTWMNTPLPGCGRTPEDLIYQVR